MKLKPFLEIAILGIYPGKAGFYVGFLKGGAPPNRNLVNAGCAFNGKIYVNAGFEGETSSLLVIDYEKHKIITAIGWNSALISADEQEQCAIYKG